jgi:kumamolisin
MSLAVLVIGFASLAARADISIAPDEAAAQVKAAETGLPAMAGPVAKSVKLDIEVVMSLRNQGDLDALVPRLSNPYDKEHGHYLTPEQFAAEYGPAKADVKAAVAFLKANGLTVTHENDIQGLVRATGTVSDIEKAFNITMYRYASPSKRIYYSSDTTPTLPANLAGKVVAVLGLNTGAELHSDWQFATPKPLGSQNLNYSGYAGLTPADIESIYKMGSIGTSIYAGGTLAVFEEGTFYPSDVDEYFSTYIGPLHYGEPVPTMVPISVDGYNTNSTPGPVQPEVVLDLDMFCALSANSFYEIFENSDQITSDTSFIQQLIDTFKSMANVTGSGLRLPSVISVSYGVSENWLTPAWNPNGPSEEAAENQALEQLAAQGQTVCVSSGDAAAWTDQSKYPTEAPSTSDPASQPYVTAVGGTNLVDSATAPYQYVSESSWYDFMDIGRGYFGTGSGGGISELWPIPWWQVGAFNPAVNPQGSLTMRNVPDISLYGDYDTGGYDVYLSAYGGWNSVNGTSASSPLFAAFLADVNSQRSTALGLANPLLYSVAENPSFAGDFNDIADGSTNGYYAAVPGYDNSTGWGTINGANLLKQLSLHDTYTNLAASSGTVVAGQPVTFTATVGSSDGGNPSGGTVTFTGIVAGTPESEKMIGDTASFTSSFATAGKYAVTAEYDGSTANQVSFGSFTETVAPKNTTTTLTASPTVGTYGHPVTFTATVAVVAPGFGTPTGTVSFDIVSTNGNLIPMGTGALNTSGVATFTTSSLTAGANSIEAVYGGDASSNASSSAVASYVVSYYFTAVFQTPPVNVTTSTTMPNGPTPTVTGNGSTSEITALCADGGETFSYQASASGTFEWYLEWIPLIVGQAAPKTGTITFTQLASNYANMSGSFAPQAVGTLDLTAGATSTWGTAATVNLDLTAPTSGAQSSGSTTLTNLGTWTTAPVAFTASGNSAYAVFTIPASVVDSIAGVASLTGGGGGGGEATSTIELQFSSDTMNF